MSTSEQVPMDDAEMAALYAEFAAEDQEFAEEGMAEYEASLDYEDAQ